MQYDPQTWRPLVNAGVPIAIRMISLQKLIHESPANDNDAAPIEDRLQLHRWRRELREMHRQAAGPGIARATFAGQPPADLSKLREAIE